MDLLRLRSIRTRPGVFSGVRITMALTAFLAGASFCFAGSSWHSSASFYFVNQLPIPWFVYGVLLIVGGILMFIHKIRPFGYLIGAIFYSFFAALIWLAVLASLHYHHILFLSSLDFPAHASPSFFAACNVTTICVLYWSAVKQAVYIQVDPERVNLMSKPK